MFLFQEVQYLRYKVQKILMTMDIILQYDWD